VSKRDDDSQADMEVGMTTAERRRRRRRGGGLRVPSDNVPRRSSTPPVVAPVPEDPALAMSIAYSFSADSSDPMPRPTIETPVPSFENHEGMPTVIDPVSEPVEQGDFEMKTREMSAVDLEALGLSDAGISSNALPVQRMSSANVEAPGALWPVNPRVAARRDGLLARNERVVIRMRAGALGRVALVMVGAAGVGNIRLAPALGADDSARWRAAAEPRRVELSGVELARGDELGAFRLGSTVVLIFEPGRAQLAGEVGDALRFGQRIGQRGGAS